MNDRERAAVMLRLRAENEQARIDLRAALDAARVEAAEVERLRDERDRLRRRLTAHHELSHVAEHDLARWAVSDDNICPVCKEADEHAETEGVV